jgi:energy-converting hydrogenase Eha subunit B
MRKSLIAVVVTSTLCFSAPFAMADVFSTLEAEIDVENKADVTAEATNLGGSNNDVHASAAVVNIRNDASDGTNIMSNMDLDLEAENRGDLSAVATNLGGSGNDISATGAVVSITNDSSGQ